MTTKHIHPALHRHPAVKGACRRPCGVGIIYKNRKSIDLALLFLYLCLPRLQCSRAGVHQCWEALLVWLIAVLLGETIVRHSWGALQHRREFSCQHLLVREEGYNWNLMHLHRCSNLPRPPCTTTISSPHTPRASTATAICPMRGDGASCVAGHCIHLIILP